MNTITASTSTPRLPYASQLSGVRTLTYGTSRRCGCSCTTSVRRFSLLYGSRCLRRREEQTRGRRMMVMTIRCGAVREINEAQFSDAVLESDRPVLVEFVATWCGPCRLIAPAVESLAQEYEDKLKIVKIDHDSNPQLIEEYRVYGLPTLILFKDGKEVPDSRREGAITKVKLKQYVDALLQSVSVA